MEIKTVINKREYSVSDLHSMKVRLDLLCEINDRVKSFLFRLDKIYSKKLTDGDTLVIELKRLLDYLMSERFVLLKEKGQKEEHREMNFKKVTYTKSELIAIREKLDDFIRSIESSKTFNSSWSEKQTLYELARILNFLIWGNFEVDMEEENEAK